MLTKTFNPNIQNSFGNRIPLDHEDIKILISQENETSKQDLK